MRKILFVPLLFAVFFSPISAWPDDLPPSSSPESLFAEGAGFYSQGKLDESRKQFTKFLEARPNDARAHLNLATILTKQNHFGAAWAHLRKARSLNPSLPGLRDLQTKLEENPPPSIGLSGPFHRWIRPVLASIDRSMLSLILLLSVTAFIHLVIRLLRKRSWAKEADEALPQISWTSWFLLLLSVVTGGALIFQFYLSTQTYASVVQIEGEILRSLPDSEGLEVGQIPSGIELKVLREQNDWTQITNERGVSGWAPKKSLLIYPGAAK